MANVHGPDTHRSPRKTYAQTKADQNESKVNGVLRKTGDTRRLLEMTKR